MNATDTCGPDSPVSDQTITIHNHLYAGHRYRAGMEGVFRSALRDLPGRWDVSVSASGRAWVRIEVIAPDGASWSLAVPVHQGPGAEDLAETVRVACRRRSRRLRPPVANADAAAAADAAEPASRTSSHTSGGSSK